MASKRDRVGAAGLAAAVAALVGLLAWATPASAQVPGIPPVPIPENPLSNSPEFVGKPATPDKVRPRWRPVQNPFMAPDPNNNLHNDAYMTDAYRRLGPLGEDTTTASTLFARECASITFDRQGRLVMVCVGLDRPVLALINPGTLEVIAAYDLPPRQPSSDPFTTFAGGGYFYLDNHDRAVVPTGTRHIFVLQPDGGTGFSLVEDYDLSGIIGAGDPIISALPDYKGRIWFASTAGVVGWVHPRSGKIRSKDLAEPIGNSFAVDETGGVFIVTDKALYRFEAKGSKVRTVWRRTYANIGIKKPGQTQAGSGTTPTLIAKRKVAITNNADPMRIVVYRRGAKSDGRKVCSEPVFEPGAGATDQSLIAAKRSLITENNYGYSGLAAVQGGATTTPGLQRVDVRKGRCRTVWRSEEIAPSVVPKVSLRAGLVYTYTKPAGTGADDPWYFTALDFDTGETAFKRLAGGGLAFNNNYAPVTIAPDGTAYVGVLGGLTMVRDSG
jgi:hypothetical protein